MKQHTAFITALLGVLSFVGIAPSHATEANVRAELTMRNAQIKDIQENTPLYFDQAITDKENIRTMGHSSHSSHSSHRSHSSHSSHRSGY